MFFFIRISDGAKTQKNKHAWQPGNLFFFLNESGVFCFLLEGFSFYVK